MAAVCLMILIVIPAGMAVVIHEGVTVYTNDTRYLYTENITMDIMTTTDSCMIIEGGDVNDSYCLDDGQLHDFPDLNITEYLNVSPQGRVINISEGENVTFNVSEGPGGPFDWAKWFLNSVYETMADGYTYVSTYTSSETTPDNVTVYARSDGDTLTKTSWRLNIENQNLAPRIDNFSATPTLIQWGANFTATCDASDEDKDEVDLNVTIGYRRPGETAWNTENATWNGNDWHLTVETSLVLSHVGDWDVRCRAEDDKDEYSAYRTLYDAVTVNRSIVMPDDPTAITPSNGLHDVYVPFVCEGATYYNNVTRLHDFDVNINGTWEPMARNVTGNSYTFYSGRIPSNTTIKSRCRAKTSAGATSWVAGSNVTIVHGSTVHIFYDGMLRTVRMGDHVPMSIYATMVQDNQYIHSMFIDCNDDDVGDHSFRLYNRSSDSPVRLNSSHEQFTCRYSEPGRHTVRAGVIFKRVNETKSWQGVCGELGRQDERCLIERTYGVNVDAAPSLE